MTEAPYEDDVSSIDGRSLSSYEYDLAKKRKPVIDLLLSLDRISKSHIQNAAKQLSCCERTVWNIVSRYGKSHRIHDLVGRTNPRNRGKTHLHKDVEKIIAETIETYHLSKMRPTMVATFQEIRRRCADLGIKQPCQQSVYSRIRRIPDIDIMSAREGAKQARYRYKMLAGKTPETNHPLQRVQIDHTLVDLIVVDGLQRKPLRRPYITLAIDEYSRAILGFHLSFEPPSATSVGLCLVHAALPKDEWAARIGLQFDWPMHGRPDCIFVDNGTDFHSEAVEAGCEAWGIHLTYRPPGMPHYGGIIERMIGSAMRALRSVPGATGSSVQERKGLAPEQRATMTISELELYLATYFAGEYHRKLHSHHGLTPLTKWKQGVFGTKERKGIGPPAPVDDAIRLLIDFLPLVRRQVTRRGISWGKIHYMDDVLRPYVSDKKNKNFVVRRDPRDVSSIWFLSPEDNRYYPIRSRDISRPSVSLWEVEQARKNFLNNGRKDYDESEIFKAIDAQRAIVSTAIKNKVDAKRTRMSAERRLAAERSHSDTRRTTPPPQNPTTPWQIYGPHEADEDATFEIEE